MSRHRLGEMLRRKRPPDAGRPQGEGIRVWERLLVAVQQLAHAVTVSEERKGARARVAFETGALLNAQERQRGGANASDVAPTAKIVSPLQC
jgi:hypothetical protein